MREMDDPISVSFPPPASPEVDETDNTSLAYTSGIYHHGPQVDYEGLDYDPMENFVHQNELVAKTLKDFNRENMLRWVVVIFIGFWTAVFAFVIDVGVKSISAYKFELTRNIIDKCGNCFTLPFVTYVCSNFLLIGAASFLVAWVEPCAAGSGIPEIKCYLNGVKIPRVLRARTLFAKAIGVMFSVSGGLPCGKEGPMIHTGAIVAGGLSQGKAETIPFLRKFGIFKAFRNDNDKRDFVSAGAAAGVAAAFGAPVGGVLFSLEEGSSFWNQSLTWRTFACSMFCSFVLNVLVSGFILGQWGNLSQPGLATFGSFTQQGNPGYTLLQIPFFLVIGVLGGLCGALFNYVNIKLMKKRVKYRTSPWTRMLEALLVSALVSTASFGLSKFAKSCVDVKMECPSHFHSVYTPQHYAYAAHAYSVATPQIFNLPEPDTTSFIKSFQNKMFVKREAAQIPLPLQTPHIEHAFAQPSPTHCIQALSSSQFDYFCKKGQYNGMARIFFNTEEDAIRSLFHSEQTFDLQTLAIFFVVYLSLACLTYGASVPSGLFVPSILAGCALGRLVGHALQLLLGKAIAGDAGVYALVGGAAVLGGIVRMTISLTIIIVESTNDVTYGLPIMMTLMVAKWVGDYFNEGIYDLHIEEMGVPFLEWEPPFVMRKFRATNVMNKPVVCFRRVELVRRLVSALKDTTHNGFPVVDDQTCFTGLILRSQLTVLLQHRCYKARSGIKLANYSMFEKEYPRHVDIDDVDIPQADMDEWIDLTPYANLPFTVRNVTPLSRVFRLFRTMGLRHLVVVDVGNRVVGIITRKDITHLESRLVAQRRMRRGRSRSSTGSGSVMASLLSSVRPLSDDSTEIIHPNNDNSLNA